MAEILLSNPRTTLSLTPGHTATHAREGQSAGDTHDQLESLKVLDRGERAPYVYGGEHHELRRYPAGSLVLIPCEVANVAGGGQVVTGQKWECFRVESNPAYEEEEPSEGVRVVSFDDFNASRHGAE